MATEAVALVEEITNVQPHPNADKLDVCEISGYQCCIGKNTYKNGDKILYIPADMLISDKVAEKYGINKDFLGSNGRVKKIRLRGEPSFGYVIELPNEFRIYALGSNVAKDMGIKKWEPPISTSGLINKCKAKAKNPEKYTDIDNWKNNKRRIDEISQTIGDIVVTEKLHGSNVCTMNINGEYKASSMNLERKRPTRAIKYENLTVWQKFMSKLFNKEYAEPIPFDDPELQEYVYWIPYSISKVKELIDYLATKYNSVVVYGEIYGNSIQKGFNYDAGDGLGYRIFDIKLNGKYLDFDKFMSMLTLYDLDKYAVPVLYKGPYDEKIIKELSCGKSTIGDNIREGCVWKPVIEKTHPRLGRVIFKVIGEEYDLMKNKPDSKDN